MLTDIFHNDDVDDDDTQHTHTLHLKWSKTTRRRVNGDFKHECVHQIRQHPPENRLALFVEHYNYRNMGHMQRSVSQTQRAVVYTPTGHVVQPQKPGQERGGNQINESVRCARTSFTNAAIHSLPRSIINRALQLRGRCVLFKCVCGPQRADFITEGGG